MALHHELHGPPDAPPLLLSAGLGGSGNYWKPNLAALSERYRVILYDHRGTGRSDRALPDTVTVADMADDIVEVLDTLGIERAHFMGHAAGGIAGLALALRAPERLGRLVVVNGWAAPDPHFARCFEVRLELLRASGVRAYIRAQPLFLYPANWISEHTAAIDVEEDAHVSGFPAVASQEKRIAALKAFDIADVLGGIATPTLVLAAADDMLVPSRCSDALAAGIAGAEHVVMGWGGHACNVTDPRGFEAAVLKFLEK